MEKNNPHPQGEERKKPKTGNISDTVEDRNVPADLRNRDPVTGESGCHPVGSGIGAAVGAAGVGAVAGTALGPVGTVVGAVVGGVIGGLAGKEVGESANPTVESAYWNEHFSSRPYYLEGKSFGHYLPAYRIGWESFLENPSGSWAEREPGLKKKWEDLSRWENEGGAPTLTWEEAKLAAKDAHDRLASIRSGGGSEEKPHSNRPR